MSTSSKGSLKDPSKLSFESTRTRRLILGSYWTVVFLALPLWWYTTSIERLSLPSSRVLSLFEKHLRFRLDLQLNTEGYADAVAVAKDWQVMLNQRATHEKDRWEGLDVDVHPNQHGGNVFALIFYIIITNEHHRFHKDSTTGAGTYTVSVGADETSAQNRHLSLPAANFLANASCRLGSLSYCFLLNFAFPTSHSAGRYSVGPAGAVLRLI
jgi:phosphatidylinositol glycan class S